MNFSLVESAGSQENCHLKCPKHDIPFTLESSSDPVNEGAWKHYYCKKCRQERMEGKSGAATFK